MFTGIIQDVGRIRAVEQRGGDVRLAIAVAGVCLTVNAVAGAEFDINLVPHTLTVTTLGELQPGARVNVEIDTMARYAERLLLAGEPGDRGTV